MTQDQARAVEGILRAAGLDYGGDVTQVRAQFDEFITGVPLPADVRTEPGVIGGVPVVTVHIDTPAEQQSAAHGTVLYLHGGAYAIGSAAAAAGLAAEISRRTGMPAISVDYRLAPEHPYPAAVEDTIAVYRALLDAGTLPGDIVFGGESAGAGLVAAVLVALRNAGLPLPAAAWLASPWADLSVSGDTVSAKAAVDPVLTEAALTVRSRDYLAGQDPEDGRISPVFADLIGLPPLLIQVGSHEILLADATRLATRAALADVAVTLQVTPGVPHVFVAFAGMLDEADQALDAAAAFLASHVSAS